MLRTEPSSADPAASIVLGNASVDTIFTAYVEVHIVELDVRYETIDFSGPHPVPEQRRASRHVRGMATWQPIITALIAAAAAIFSALIMSGVI